MEHKHHGHGKPPSSGNIRTVNAIKLLRRKAAQQEPLQAPFPDLKVSTIENYFLVISAMEDNLADFKTITDSITEVWQYVCMTI